MIATDSHSGLFDQFRELVAYRYLISNLVIRDLKVRYKNSALGFFWSFLNPLMQIAVLTIVFKYIMGSKIPNFTFLTLPSWIFTYIEPSPSTRRFWCWTRRRARSIPRSRRRSRIRYTA